MNRAIKYIIGIMLFCFFKIEYVNKNSDYGSYGFVMKKRIGSMLLITPVMLIVYFFIYGISCFKKWFNFIISYRCHYVCTAKRKLSFKENLHYLNFFIKDYL